MYQETPEIIDTLEKMEIAVNNYARKAAQKHNVREDIFTIHLVRKLARGDMSVIGGPHIEIYLLWPAVQPQLNSKLDSAFTLIRKKSLWQPLSLATHAYFMKEAGEGKKWVRQRLGDDIADTIGSLLPKHRLQTIVTVVTEVKDKVTGTSILRSEQKVSDHRDAPLTMWSLLSQNVMDKHPETVEYENEKLITSGSDNGDIQTTQ